MSTDRQHGIPRQEWELMFAARIRERLAMLPTECADVVRAELESWPEHEADWMEERPGDAADDNLSYWTDDEH